MATLSIKEVSNRPDKPQSAETFIKKIMHEENFASDFKADEGLFSSHFITVMYDDGTKKEYRPSTDKNKNQKLIHEYIARGPFVKGIDVVGTLTGQTAPKTIKVSKLLKTEEFGGQPSSGKKINLGIKFEKDLYAKMYECLEGKKCVGPYSKAADYIIKESSKMVKSSAIEFEDTGKRNTSRPIVASGSSIYINPKNPDRHGALLSDIDIVHKSGKRSYLSLKYGSTLTFMNAGVGKIFTESDMKKNKITTPAGKAILEAFSINEKMFCDVFNKYGKNKDKFPSVKIKPNMSALKSLLSTGIGSDYWMVHGQPGGAVHFWYMDPKRNKAFSKVSGDITIYYGGKSGNGKRIDIEFSNSFFDFTMNIRNKQRGLYPSHIMLDYKSKDAIGKTKIM